MFKNTCIFGICTFQININNDWCLHVEYKNYDGWFEMKYKVYRPEVFIAFEVIAL